MKFHIGDHVKYNSGDWCFFCTITAIIENSINPSYRLIVDRMEKKNCRFSLTPFEFELFPNEELAPENENLKLKNAEIEYLNKLNSIQPQKPSPLFSPHEPAIFPKPSPAKKPTKKPTKKPSIKPTPIPLSKPALQPEEQQPEEPKLSIIEPSPIPETSKPKIKRTPKPKPLLHPKELPPADLIPEEPKPDMIVVLPSSPVPSIKEKKLESWYKNLESYMNGERNNTVQKWISYNRNLFKRKSLSEEKRNKLIAINFPFEASKRTERPKEFKDQNKTYQRNTLWDYKIKQWKSGEYEALKRWRQKCVRLYVTHKLPQERIDQLKELGILH